MPTIITKTIGPVGRDYTTFAAAEAEVSTIPTTDDMVLNDEAIVFEVDAGTYNETVVFDSSNPGPGLTMDATRNITYRPAAGSEHGGDRSAGVILNGGSESVNVKDSHTHVQNLVIHGSSYNGDGVIVDSCILLPRASSPTDGTVVNGPAGTSISPVVFKNCVSEDSGAHNGIQFFVGGAGRPIFAEITNCTFIKNGPKIYDPSNNGPVTLKMVNNSVLGGQVLNFADIGGHGVITGSNNVGGATSPFPVAQQALSQTWTFSTNPADPSTGNRVIYDATTGALLNVPGNDAVGVGTSTGAPTTDINGEDRIRDTFADPGAFTAELLTLTKTIDAAGGGDYTTFLAAEGAVTTFLPSDNLIERNTAIVFEAEAGDYSESGVNVSFTSSLVSDATRNVKWTFASGSEHGGDPASGVRCTWLAPIINDSFVIFDGLVFAVTASEGVQPRGTEGNILRNLIVDQSAGGYGISAIGNCGTPTAPLVVENCRVLAGTSDAIRLRRTTAVTPDGSVRVVNNTASTASSGDVDVYVFTSTTGTLFAEVSNNLAVGAGFAWASSAGTTVSGSGNVGGSNFPFPVAQQALSQTWTFSTNPADLSTGSQVIYDATNGAMVDAPGNDAWQILTDLSVAPATDIEGVTREATGYNPGAFERTAADVGTPIGGGVDYLRDLNIRDRFLRGAAIREPFIRNLRD